MYDLPFPASPIWALPCELHVGEQPKTIAARFLHLCSAATWSGFDSSIWTWILTGYLKTTLGVVRMELGPEIAAEALNQLLTEVEVPEHLQGLAIDMFAYAFLPKEVAADAGV